MGGGRRYTEAGRPPGTRCWGPLGGHAAPAATTGVGIAPNFGTPATRVPPGRAAGNGLTGFRDSGRTRASGGMRRVYPRHTVVPSSKFQVPSSKFDGFQLGT